MLIKDIPSNNKWWYPQDLQRKEKSFSLTMLPDNISDEWRYSYTHWCKSDHSTKSPHVKKKKNALVLISENISKFTARIDKPLWLCERDEILEKILLGKAGSWNSPPFLAKIG